MFGLLDRSLDLPKYTKCLNNQCASSHSRCTFQIVIGFREGEKRNNILVLQSGEPWYPRHVSALDWFGFACWMLIGFISVVGKLQTACYIQKFHFYLSNWAYRTILLFDNPSLFRNFCPSCAVLGMLFSKYVILSIILPQLQLIRLFGNAFKIGEQKFIWHSLYAMCTVYCPKIWGQDYFSFFGKEITCIWQRCITLIKLKRQERHL